MSGTRSLSVSHHTKRQRPKIPRKWAGGRTKKRPRKKKTGRHTVRLRTKSSRVAFGVTKEEPSNQPECQPLCLAKKNRARQSTNCLQCGARWSLRGVKKLSLRAKDAHTQKKKKQRATVGLNKKCSVHAHLCRIQKEKNRDAYRRPRPSFTQTSAGR